MARSAAAASASARAGITAPTRHPMVPDAPTIKELGVPQATVTVWYGMLAPSKAMGST